MVVEAVEAVVPDGEPDSDEPEEAVGDSRGGVSVPLAVVED